MVDLTLDPEPQRAEAKPNLKARAASVAEHQDMVLLLQEQLRQARDDLSRRKTSYDAAVKVENGAFSAYKYFKPGEVVDLTDM